MSDAQTLDGNAVAGLLREVLSGDPTTVGRRCPDCGAEAPLGAHRAHRGAGVVLRCPGCGAVAAVVAEQAARLVVHVRGALLVPRAG
ncbi:MAG: hypothetical protein IRZ32_14255 [Solirubrobacteraceae bacterium]|nr:hypothetical protein [Solirubrobacteraceae bacterium]